MAPNGNAPITSLSGGNQQKVLLARWLALDPRFLLLNDPTRGVDIATRQTLYGVFRELARDGMALVVLSSEIEEIVALCDRVLVFREDELFDDAFRRRPDQRAGHRRHVRAQPMTVASDPKPARAAGGIIRAIWRRTGFAPALLVVLLILNVWLNPARFPPGAWGTLIGLAAPLIGAALASTPAILGGRGGIDVSVGPTMGFVNAILVKILIMDLGVTSPFVIIPAALLIGAGDRRDQRLPRRLCPHPADRRDARHLSDPGRRDADHPAGADRHGAGLAEIAQRAALDHADRGDLPDLVGHPPAALLRPADGDRQRRPRRLYGRRAGARSCASSPMSSPASSPASPG